MFKMPKKQDIYQPCESNMLIFKQLLPPETTGTHLASWLIGLSD